MFAEPVQLLKASAASKRPSKKAAGLRWPLPEFDLTDGDDHNHGLGPIHNDDLGHRDGPNLDGRRRAHPLLG